MSHLLLKNREALKIRSVWVTGEELSVKEVGPQFLKEKERPVLNIFERLVHAKNTSVLVLH